MKLSSLKIDVDSAENGKWVPITPTCKLRIARRGNKKAQETLERLLKPHKTIFDANAMPDEMWKQIMDEVIATSLLTGWVGLKDDNDEEIPYSVSKAMEIMGDVSLEALREFVLKTAGDLDTFRNNDLVADIKN